MISRTRQALESVEVGESEGAVLTLFGDNVEQLSQGTAQTLVLLFVKVVGVVARNTTVGGRSRRKKPISLVALTSVYCNVVVGPVPAGLTGAVGDITVLWA